MTKTVEVMLIGNQPTKQRLVYKMMEKMDKEHANLVTKDQFWPVKTLVYSGTGVILLAVLGAMVALVINN